MPLPIIDASQALKASPEKTEDALLKVREELLMVPVLQNYCRIFVCCMLYATTSVNY